MKFILAILVTLTVSTSFAWKGMGGGGGSSTSGGVLDLDEAKNLTKLDTNVLWALVNSEIPDRMIEFPQMKFIVGRVLLLKYWNLSSAPLNPGCQAKTLGNVQPDIIGCQSSIEIRMSKKWWDKASTRERAALVLHEAILAFFEETPYDSDSVRPIVAALMTKTKTPDEVREAFQVSGFGLLASRRDVLDLQRYTLETTSQLCTLGHVTKDSDWIFQSPYYMNAAIFAIRDRLIGLRSIGKDSFCARPLENTERDVLIRWMRVNPLPLYWLDRLGSDVDQEARRIWAFIGAL